MSGDSVGAPFLDHALYDGQEIADRGDVIVVSVGYRLGVLGFLSRGDSSLPGKSSFHWIVQCTFYPCYTLYTIC